MRSANSGRSTSTARRTASPRSPPRGSGSDPSGRADHADGPAPRRVEHALTGLLRAIRARGRFGCFDWTFASGNGDISIEGHISALASGFVGLRYTNPPGGAKACLNSKIASCRVLVEDRRTGRRAVLETPSRAAFEILSDESCHGIMPMA